MNVMSPGQNNNKKIKERVQTVMRMSRTATAAAAAADDNLYKPWGTLMHRTFNEQPCQAAGFIYTKPAPPRLTQRNDSPLPVSSRLAPTTDRP